MGRVLLLLGGRQRNWEGGKVPPTKSCCNLPKILKVGYVGNYRCGGDVGQKGGTEKKVLGRREVEVKRYLGGDQKLGKLVTTHSRIAIFGHGVQY